MEVKISLQSPEGETITDINALQEEIEDQLTAAANEPGVALSGPQKSEPPKGAQGLPEILHWVLEVASNNPEVMLKPLLYGLKELISHYRPRRKEGDKDNVTIVVVVGDNPPIDLGQKDLQLDKEIDEATNDRSSAKD
jgi:hypothetical protein